MGVGLIRRRPAPGRLPAGEPQDAHRRHPGHHLVGADGQPVAPYARNPRRAQPDPRSPR
jgi:hypothetical protein